MSVQKEIRTLYLAQQLPNVIFFSRYDYEQCAGDPCNEMMNRLQDFVDNKDNIGKEFVAAGGKAYKVSKADDFEYTDPIDKSVAKNQVILNLSLLDPHWIA